MPDPPDPQLWMHYLPVALAAVVPSALFTLLLCWFLWGRRRPEPLDHFGEIPGDVAEKPAGRSDDDDARQLQGLKQRMAEMERQKHEAVQSVLLKSKQELARAMDEIQGIRQERDALVRQLEEMPGEESREGEETSVDPDEVLELKEALRESEYQVSRLGTEIQLLRTIRTEFEVLQADNQDLEDELNRYRVERSDLEDALNTMRVEKRDLEEELQESRSGVEESASKMRALTQSLEDALAREEEAKREVKNLQEAAVREERGGGSEGAVDEAVEVAGAFGTVYESEPDEVDDLTLIEGLSAGLEGKLNAIGVYHYDQIAAWEPAQIEAISQRLGFQDRIARDRWVEQAARMQEGAEVDSDEGTAQSGEAGESEDTESKERATAAEKSEDDVVVAHESGADEAGGCQSVLFFPEFSPRDGSSDKDEAKAEVPSPSPAVEGDVEDSDSEHEDAAPSSEDRPVPLVADAIDRDADLLEEDPALGPIYRRPPSQIDDLTRIKGIARVIEGRLHEIGVFRFRQIAVWTDDQVTAFSKRLNFRDRIARDRWIAQCQELHREKYGAPVPNDQAEDTRNVS